MFSLSCVADGDTGGPVEELLRSDLLIAAQLFVSPLGAVLCRDRPLRIAAHCPVGGSAPRSLLPVLLGAALEPPQLRSEALRSGGGGIATFALWGGPQPPYFLASRADVLPGQRRVRRPLKSLCFLGVSSSPVAGGR